MYRSVEQGINNNAVHNIKLNENPYPVKDVFAEIIDDNAVITWTQQNTLENIFILDDGTSEHRLSLWTGTHSLGNMF